MEEKEEEMTAAILGPEKLHAFVGIGVCLSVCVSVCVCL